MAQDLETNLLKCITILFSFGAALLPTCREITLCTPPLPAANAMELFFGRYTELNTSPACIFSQAGYQDSRWSANAISDLGYS